MLRILCVVSKRTGGGVLRSSGSVIGFEGRKKRDEETDALLIAKEETLAFGLARIVVDRGDRETRSTEDPVSVSRPLDHFDLLLQESLVLLVLSQGPFQEFEFFAGSV